MDFFGDFDKDPFNMSGDIFADEKRNRRRLVELRARQTAKGGLIPAFKKIKQIKYSPIKMGKETKFSPERTALFSLFRKPEERPLGRRLSTIEAKEQYGKGITGLAQRMGFVRQPGEKEIAKAVRGYKYRSTEKPQSKKIIISERRDIRY